VGAVEGALLSRDSSSWRMAVDVQVPVVTRRLEGGKSVHAANVSASILSQAGLSELVAADEDEMVDIAVALATADGGAKIRKVIDVDRHVLFQLQIPCRACGLRKVSLYESFSCPYPFFFF